MDALYSASAGSIGTRRRSAPAPIGRARDSGRSRHAGSRRGRRARGEAQGRKGIIMAREIITIECTEARKEGKSPSRYTMTRNKKLKTEKLELRKYNPAMRRH